MSSDSAPSACDLVGPVDVVGPAEFPRSSATQAQCRIDQPNAGRALGEFPSRPESKPIRH